MTVEVRHYVIGDGGSDCLTRRDSRALTKYAAACAVEGRPKFSPIGPRRFHQRPAILRKCIGGPAEQNADFNRWRVGCYPICVFVFPKLGGSNDANQHTLRPK